MHTSDRRAKGCGRDDGVFSSALVRTLVICLVLSVPAWASAQPRNAAGSNEAGPYEFGVFPFAPPETIEAVFAPIAAELGRALGRPVRFQTAPDFESFMKRLEKQEFDIAHIQPFDYVRIARPAGYELSAGRNEQLYAAVMVRQDGPLRRASDLKNKRLGTPPKVAAVTILARAALRTQGIDPDRDLHLTAFSTHPACLQALLIGDVDACAVSRPQARLFEDQMGVTFRVITESSRVPHTVFVVHERVPARDRERIRAALLAMTISGTDGAMQKVFATIQGRPFRRISDDEFRVVEEHLAVSECNDP